LFPGVRDFGSIDGTCYLLHQTTTIYGLWYDQGMFNRYGWNVLPTSTTSSHSPRL